METFTAEELQNISRLITRVSDIKGSEALPVAVLQQKLQIMYEAAVKAEAPKVFEEPQEKKK